MTDEILERLRTYKDFADLKKKIEEEDSNNQIVIEILEQNVSMVNDEKVDDGEVEDSREGTCRNGQISGETEKETSQRT